MHRQVRHVQLNSLVHLVLICTPFFQPEHVIQFLFSEMGTTGSVDGAGRLVIKGRFQQKQVENVLRRYIGKSPPACQRLTASDNCALSGIRYMQDL